MALSMTLICLYPLISACIQIDLVIEEIKSGINTILIDDFKMSCFKNNQCYMKLQKYAILLNTCYASEFLKIKIPLFSNERT